MRPASEPRFKNCKYRIKRDPYDCEHEKARERARMPGMRPPGSGRPTKRERRELDDLLEE